MLGESRISAEAIRTNASVLASADPGFVADLSFDAYGHGAVTSARAAREGGARRFAVATEREAQVLSAAGFAEVLVAPDRTSVALELYGLGEDPAWVPAMTVAAPVVGLKGVEAGDGVSYGYTFRAAASSTLALVGIGYADGLDRIAGNHGTVLLGQRLRPIVGRVAMNVMMVDLGDDDCSLGDEVIVIGNSRRPTDWANQLQRSVPEVVIEFGSRLRRVFA